MAPMIPKGFGATRKVDEKAEASKSWKARPPPKKDVNKKTVTSETSSPKKRSIDDSCEVIKEGAKRQKTEGAPSFVETQLGSLIVPFIKDKDIKSWQTMKM